MREPAVGGLRRGDACARGGRTARRGSSSAVGTPRACATRWIESMRIVITSPASTRCTDRRQSPAIAATWSCVFPCKSRISRDCLEILPPCAYSTVRFRTVELARWSDAPNHPDREPPSRIWLVAQPLFGIERSGLNRQPRFHQRPQLAINVQGCRVAGFPRFH